MKFSGKVRAGRGCLDWMQDDLASHAGLTVQTIRNVESQGNSPTGRTQKKIEQAFARHGVIFTTRGIEQTNSPIFYEGKQGFEAFMDDVYDVAKEEGGDIYLFNSRPRLWTEWLGEDWYAMHSERMNALGKKINIKITIEEGDKDIILKTAHHKWFPKGLYQNKIFYAYGSKLAFLDFEENQVYITVITQKEFADIFRVLYDVAWENVASDLPTEA